MKLSYDKLWTLMRKNKMKKNDLMRAAEISQYTLSRLNHDQPVGLDVLMNVCKVFHCQLNDVVEMIED